MSFTLSLNEIKPLFETNTFARGMNVYREDKVISVNQETTASDHIIKLTGKTKGSFQERYTQHISITIGTNNTVLNGTCSCPVGYNCKHCAAVCIQASRQFAPQTTKTTPQPTKTTLDTTQETSFKFQAWMSLFANIQSDTLPDKPTEHEYRYILFQNYITAYNDPLDVGHSEINIFIQRPTRKGKLNKPKKVNLANFIAQTTSGYSDLPETAIQIGELLIQCANSKWHATHITFKEAIGHLALKTLVETGQAYFQTPNFPLQWLPTPIAKPLQFNEAQRRFELPILPNEFWVFCEPPLLINTQKHTIQPIESSLSAISLFQLIDMPSIPQALLPQFLPLLEEEQTRLQKQKKQTPLPLPKIPGMEDKIIDTPPQPILRLLRSAEDANNIYFELDLYYPPYTCRFYPQTKTLTQRIEGIKVILKRQLQQENDFIARLENLLTPLDTDTDLGNDSPYILDDEPPSSLILYLKGASLHTQQGLQSYLALQAEMPQLEQEGWIFEGFEGQHLDIHNIDDITVESHNQTDWFELGFDMVIQGQKVPLEPIIQLLIGQYETSEEMPDTLQILTDSQIVLEFNKTQIAPIFDTLIQLYKTHNQHQGNTLRLDKFDAHLIAGLSDAPIQWLGSKDSLKLAEKLHTFKGIEPITPPKGLNATLREYQQFGLNWIGFLHQFGFNGILADDMGLGKTLQTLSFLLHLKENKLANAPTLLIVPTSLIGNWKAEAKRFTPDLTLLTLHGPERFAHFEQIPNYDLIITTYPLIPRDIDTLQTHKFHHLILDEAQKIKNPATKLYQGILNLKSQHRLALTGTPVENHLGELWSILNFLMPGFLGNIKHFRNTYQKPIENEHSRDTQAQLNQKVAPFLLRRTKHQVATELPDKTEIIRKVEFEKDQAQLYETIRLTMTEKVRQAVEQNGLAKSQITLLDALLKLRQVCCDPGLVKFDAAKKVKHSAKLELLMDLVKELLDGNHRILIFSQFTSMLTIIKATLDKANIPYTSLTGQTRKREEAIQKFRTGQVPIFLISLKAGGVGLNLTEADSVIHYDPWWNPATENQATDRAYRIGQNKEVFVYKLIVANSIEEKILEMQTKKQTLQDQLYQTKNTQNQQPDHKNKLTGEDLLNLLQT